MTATPNAKWRTFAATGGRGWWVVGLALATMVLLWLGGDRVAAVLRYDRVLVLHGEYWRLMTGHMVHGSLRHMALNVVGASIVALLLVRTYSIAQWVLILTVSTVAIGIGFIVLEPQLQWYVGASGVLHGALAAGAIAWWRAESRPMALALSVIVVGKLIWEQWQGALPLVDDMPVIVDAHLYGAFGGAVTSSIIELTTSRTRSKVQEAPL